MIAEMTASDNSKIPDILVVGSGPSGMMAAIAAASLGATVTVLEQMKKPGMKLLATGGRRCNLTNTKSPSDIMADFGPTGRFMSPAMDLFDNSKLRAFFHNLGVGTHSPDGFRVWPVTHKATSIHSALLNHATSLGIEIVCDCEVKDILVEEAQQQGVKTSKGLFRGRKLIMATGGLSLSSTGATGSGYRIASAVGHKIKPTFPSGVPLLARETWMGSCTADTIAKVKAKVDPIRGKGIKGAKRIAAAGDLIFTRKGIAGPLALNLSREIAQMLHQEGEIPIELNLVQNASEGSVDEYLRSLKTSHPKMAIDDALAKYAPASLRQVMLDQLEQPKEKPICEIPRNQLLHCAKFLTKNQMTIYGTTGFTRAIATKGGVDLKGIDPKTLMSKSIDSLFFCGELVDMDGPCGGYNLTWAFASGRLAGTRAAEYH